MKNIQQVNPDQPGILIEIDTDGYLDISQHRIGNETCTLAEATEYNDHYLAVKGFKRQDAIPLFWLPLNVAVNLNEGRFSTPEDFVPKTSEENGEEDGDA